MENNLCNSKKIRRAFRFKHFNQKCSNGLKTKLHYTILVFTLLIMYNETIGQHTAVPLLRWKEAAKLPTPSDVSKQLGVAGPFAGFHEDALLVAGGANFPDGMPWLGGKKKYYSDVFVFTKKTDGTLALFPVTFHLPYAVAYGASVSTPQGIVCAGGESEAGIVNSAFLLQWNKLKKEITVQSLPSLPIAVTNAFITADGNNVYLAGGETQNNVSTHFYVLDVSDTTKGWQELPSLPQPTSHAVILTQQNENGKEIYIIGGRKKNRNGISDIYATVFKFDVIHQKWSKAKPLPYPLSAGTGVAFGSHSILLFGGDRGETFHKTEGLIAAINKEKDESKKEELIAQKAAVQSSHPGFSHDVLLYDTNSDTWKTNGIIPFAVPATTTAVKWGNDVFIPSGEIKAGVRTPQILGVEIK